MLNRLLFQLVKLNDRFEGCWHLFIKVSYSWMLSDQPDRKIGKGGGMTRGRKVDRKYCWVMVCSAIEADPKNARRSDSCLH